MVHILQTILELLGSGLGVWAVTEGVKKVNAIPISEGQTAALRTTAAVLSAGSVLVLGLVNKDLQPTDAQHALEALTGFAITWLTAHSAHKVQG